MPEKKIGLLGAASFVGESLRPLLEKECWQITSFSRQGRENTVPLRLPDAEQEGSIENWVYLAPIWTLPEHFQLLEKYGIRRLVALSSTSRYTKISSDSPSDRALAVRLQEGEEKVMEWAKLHEVTVVILQPTLIYGRGKDRNVTQIATFIQRFGFFPLLGKGKGLRQPIYVDDVAAACCSALKVPVGTKRMYIISGGEVLPYRAMVERIFMALDRSPRFIHFPLSVFSITVRIVNLLPAFKGLTMEMAMRMNKDQDFDHSEATADLGFSPRGFDPQRYDLINSF